MRSEIDLSIFAGSKFRSKFNLKSKDLDYIKEKGLKIIKSHALDFINKRLAPAFPQNDGKQTPMKGHPVFIAQHATATCCRKCLFKWHNIPIGQELTPAEIDYILKYLMKWIELQLGMKYNFTTVCI